MNVLINSSILGAIIVFSTFVYSYFYQIIKKTGNLTDRLMGFPGAIPQKIVIPIHAEASRLIKDNNAISLERLIRIQKQASTATRYQNH